MPFLTINSTESTPRLEIKDFVAVQEELCPREGCTVSRLAHCAADSKPNGLGGGKSSFLFHRTTTNEVQSSKMKWLAT